VPTQFDPTSAHLAAVDAARHWGLKLGPPFALSTVSYVAPAGELVVKVAWHGDDESLHEPEALALWDGDGAVRLRERHGRAVLVERAVPGDDLAAVPEPDAVAAATAAASKLWRRTQPPFRPVVPEVRRWLDRAARSGSELVPLAREVLAQIGDADGWLVHGDFHHHNILQHGDRYVAIDPKPYAADREYDVPSLLWNPRDNPFDDRVQIENRIAAFVEAGLDDSRIRAWTVIRVAYLRPELAGRLAALL
jgi:streptomycin 6-kinase